MRNRRIAAFFASLLVLISAQAEGIHVSGQLRIVNGTSEVPVGLFGVHATPLTPSMVADWGIESVRTIDIAPTGKPLVPGGSEKVPAGLKQIVECFFDRYQPAKILTNPGWKEDIEKLARTYAANARSTGFQQTVEFWNEPYLNWATKPGVNYDGSFYEPGAEGKAMTIKGGDKPLDSLVWSKQLVAVDEMGRVDHLASSYALPLVWKGQLKEGDEYVFRKTKKLRIESRPWGKDPGQSSWFSGPQNSQFYRWMFLPFAKTLKETNPAVQLVGGWDFNICQDNWAAWPVLFKPLIDESIPWLDGLDEHHYGGDTRLVAGTYEVVNAYARAEHGKGLKFYNTEAGGLLDPERPDALGAPKWTGSSAAEKQGAFSYFLRDVIHLLDECPDKAASRAAHEATANSGNELAFKFLKDLRGNLLAVESTTPKMWAVASIKNDQVCVIIFNDDKKIKTIPFAMNAPDGATFAGGFRTEVDSEPALVSTTVSASGTMFAESVTVGPKAAVKYVFKLSAPIPPVRRKAVIETQYVAKGVINRFVKGQVLALEIRLPAAELKSATGARLKIVQEFWNAQSRCKLNGTPIKLNVQETWTHVQPLDAALLKETNSLVFETESDQPVNIDMASIVLVRAGEPSEFVSK